MDSVKPGLVDGSNPFTPGSFTFPSGECEPWVITGSLISWLLVSAGLVFVVGAANNIKSAPDFGILSSKLSRIKHLLLLLSRFSRVRLCATP